MEILKHIEKEDVDQVLDCLDTLNTRFEEEEEIDMDLVDDLLESLTQCSNKKILINVLQFVEKIGYLDDREPIDGSSLIECINEDEFEKLTIMVDNLYKNQGLFDPCPLHHAITVGDLQVVKLLEKNGFVMVSGDGGECEFTEAIYSGYMEIVKYYCEEVAEKRGGFDPKENKWVQRALTEGHKDVADYLSSL